MKELLKSTGPKPYAVVPKKMLLKILEHDGRFFFGKKNENMVTKDFTVYLGEVKYCTCKNVEETLKVIGYYF